MVSSMSDRERTCGVHGRRYYFWPQNSGSSLLDLECWLYTRKLISCSTMDRESSPESFLCTQRSGPSWPSAFSFFLIPILILDNFTSRKSYWPNCWCSFCLRQGWSYQEKESHSSIWGRIRCNGYSLGEADWFCMGVRNMGYGLDFLVTTLMSLDEDSAYSRFISSSIKQYLLNFKPLSVVSSETRNVRVLCGQLHKCKVLLSFSIFS